MRVDRRPPRPRFRFLPRHCPNCGKAKGDRCYGPVNQQEGVFLCCLCGGETGRQIGRSREQCLQLIHIKSWVNRQRLAALGWKTKLNDGKWTAKERNAVIAAFARGARERELMDLLPGRTSEQIRRYWYGHSRKREDRVLAIAEQRKAARREHWKRIKAEIVRMQHLPIGDIACKLRLSYKSVEAHRRKMGLTKPKARLARYADGRRAGDGVLGVLQRMEAYDLTVYSNHLHPKVADVLRDERLVSTRVVRHPIREINKLVYLMRINAAGRALIAGVPEVRNQKIGARQFFLKNARGRWVPGANSSLSPAAAARIALAA